MLTILVLLLALINGCIIGHYSNNLRGGLMIFFSGFAYMAGYLLTYHL